MVDLSFLEKFTKGDKTKMKKYIGMYLAVAPESFVKMRENIEQQDWDLLRINAHSLKPQADFMGLPKLKAVLAQIELDVQKGNYTELAQLYKEALDIHYNSEPKLRNSLEE